MKMHQLTIKLSAAELKALRTMAANEIRTLPEMARWLIREKLSEDHVLHKNFVWQEQEESDE